MAKMTRCDVKGVKELPPNSAVPLSSAEHFSVFQITVFSRNFTVWLTAIINLISNYFQ